MGNFPQSTRSILAGLDFRSFLNKSSISLFWRIAIYSNLSGFSHGHFCPIACRMPPKLGRLDGSKSGLVGTELKIEPRAKSPPATSSSGRRNFIPPILGAPQNWGGGGNFRHPRIISFDKVIKSRGCKYVAPLGPNFVPKGDQIWFSPLPLVTTEKKYTTFSKRQNDALKRNRQSESFVVNAQNSQLPESLVTPRMPGRPTLLWSAPCNILICAFALPLNGDILEYYHRICKKSS